MDRVNSNVWVIGTIAVIWFSVLVTSLGSPDLVFGDEPVVINVAAIINWFWGLLGSVFLLRATIFRRPNEIGWGETDSWPWVALVVGIIWLIAIFISLTVPEVVVNETISVPAASMAAPIVAAVLTLYAAEFLVAGFASREGL